MTDADIRRLISQHHKATKTALALLAHAAAAQGDALVFLESLMNNFKQVQAPGTADVFDDLAHGMLLAVSSVALKQRPDDPDARELYQGLRPGTRQ